MFLYFALFLFFLALLGNLWLVIYFIKSNGHNPPFIASLGKPKTEVIRQASLFLEQNSSAQTADLGCGSGSLLIPLAQKFPDHHFVGYEWDIIPYMLAIFKTRHLPNVTILYRDFFQEDLSRYQLVLCYLCTTIEEKIGNKLNAELNRNSLVISEIFKLSVLKLKQEIVVPYKIIKTKVYLYAPNK